VVQAWRFDAKCPKRISHLKCNPDYQPVFFCIRKINMFTDSTVSRISVLLLFIGGIFAATFCPETYAQESKDIVSPSKKTSLFTMSLDELMSLTAKVEVASLFEEDELMVGSSVASVPAATWGKMGARRMHEVLDNEPGVMTYSSIGGTPAIAIRGYTSNFSSVRGLATMIDGVPLNTLSYGTALYGNPNWELGTLNKVEMLKGPGSAIYGSDAFHGVVSMSAFDSEKDLVMLEMAGGNPWFFQGSIKLSRGFSANRFRIDFSAGGSHNGDEGMVYKRGSSGPGRWDNVYDSFSSSLKLTYHATDRLTIKAGVYGNGFDASGFKGLGSIAGLNDLFESGYDTSSGKTKFFMGTASFVYTLPRKISLEAGAYRWKNASDFTGAFVDFADGTYLPGHTISNIGFEDLRTGFTVTLKQPDNKLHLQWMLAYSYATLSTPSSRYDFLDAQTGEVQYFPANPNGKLSFQGLDRQINSVFTQTKWGIVPEKLYLLLGGRYDHYSDVVTGFTPRAGLIYLPTKTSALKFLYGQAFRAPVGAEIGGALTTMGNKYLKPELVNTYEIVYLLKGKSSRFQVNTFLSDWKDGIFFEGKSGLPKGYTSQYVNVSHSRAYGFEGKISYHWKPFVLNAGGSYIKSRLLGSGANPDYFDAFPRYMFQSGITYEAPKGWSLYLNDRFYWHMREATGDYIPHSKMLPLYWRTDITATRNFGHKLQLNIAVRNLFNRHNAKPSLYAGIGGIPEYGTNLQIRLGHIF
jgi:outer membrane receptor protein involved in Fe transport